MHVRFLSVVLSSAVLLLSCDRQNSHEAERMNGGGKDRNGIDLSTKSQSMLLDSLSIYISSGDDDTSARRLRFDGNNPAIIGVANGRFDGPYVGIEQGRPFLFGMYRNGEEIGIWYLYSHTNSRLLSTVEHKPKRSTRRIRRMGGDTVFVPYRVHVIDYWENGKIESEGDAVYDEDWQIDYYKVGRWTYYDSTGKIRSKKTFLEAIE